MGGHHGPPEVPDYRIYKVEGVRQLERTKRMLAQHGLKDPWLRLVSIKLFVSPVIPKFTNL